MTLQGKNEKIDAKTLVKTFKDVILEGKENFLMSCISSLKDLNKKELAGFIMSCRSEAIKIDNKAFSNLNRYLKAGFILKGLSDTSLQTLFKNNPIKNLLGLSTVLKPYSITKKGGEYSFESNFKTYTLSGINTTLLELEEKKKEASRKREEANKKKAEKEKNQPEQNSNFVQEMQILDTLKEAVKVAIPNIQDNKLEQIEKYFLDSLKKQAV